MGTTRGQLGPTGPRWAPCWPHELCYLGLYHLLRRKHVRNIHMWLATWIWCGIMRTEECVLSRCLRMYIVREYTRIVIANNFHSYFLQSSGKFYSSIICVELKMKAPMQWRNNLSPCIFCKITSTSNSMELSMVPRDHLCTISTRSDEVLVQFILDTNPDQRWQATEGRGVVLIHCR